jgi:DNA recombination protein RmuC
MEYIVPTLLGLALGYVGYLLGRRTQPQQQADLAVQQELTSTKALLTAAESRRMQDTTLLQTERDNALIRANAAETGLARAEEAKAAAQRTLEETKLSFGELEKRMREAFANAAQSQLTQSREQFIGMAEQKFAPFKSQLDELTRTNNELKGSLKTSNERSEKVAEEARKLAAAMTSTNKQGSWGELQLSRVAELTGMSEYVNFDTQSSTAGEEGSLRPDMVVKLPGNRCIIVDAKAPTKSYIEACACADETERARLMADFAGKVRDHARKLGAKEYWKQHKPSPEFVILFLPSEALFSAALKEDPSLIEGAWNQNVVLATPTTLLSVLRTVAHSWQQVDVEERAEKIADTAHKILEGLRLASGYFAAAGGSLNDAVLEYNKTLGALQGKVFSHGTTIVGLGGKMKAGKQITVAAEIVDRAHEALPNNTAKRKGKPADEEAEDGDEQATGEAEPSA